MWGVYDNCKPASEIGFPSVKGKGWPSHLFATFAEAKLYARQWLGSYAPAKDFEFILPYDYSGCGDLIEIREELA